MQSIICQQLKVMRTYKHYNHKHAMKLNKGHPMEFLKALEKYEDQLSETQIQANDKKLDRKYKIDNRRDKSLYGLSNSMERKI